MSKRVINFVGDSPVRTLHELLTVDSSGVCVVPVWFDSVVEGVDVWFSDDECKGQPRLRMKIKVNHADQVAVFEVYDEDVQSLAVETCPILLNLGESCSLYPDEMECYYVDAFLCRVEKSEVQEFDKLPCFVVSAICGDAGFVDMFFEEYLPDFDVFAGLSVIPFSGKLSEVPALLHSSCGSKDSINGVVPSVISPPSINGKLRVPSPEPGVFNFGAESPCARTRSFRRCAKTYKGPFSTTVETVVYSRRKSCIKRKLNFDESVDDVGANKKVAKTPLP
ncbi:replication factor A protein [Trifolium repens]|nr:replication factor A protein [Trifolium repens]